MTPPSEWILYQKNFLKTNNLSKQRCKSQMNIKIAKKQKNQTATPPPGKKQRTADTE